MRALAQALLGAALALPAQADEGGTSFWLPGQFGSLAAVPSDPGWSMPLIYFHQSSSAAGSRSFDRGGKITLGLDVGVDLLIAVPTYVFATPVFGGQASVSLTGEYGSARVDIDATLTGPNGGVASGRQIDAITGFGDLFPMASLRWNDGVNNTMVYGMLGVPVGSYDANRISNLGLNHWAVDLGGGYTYLDMKSGLEFSAVAGLTYNFENPDTQYRNGIDAHLDWGASKFVSQQVHAGLVGYFFYQLTGDSGAGARLGDFKSRVVGVGPQVGYFFNFGEKPAYLNLKGYWEFAADNRPQGWNAWLTLSLPLGN